MMRTLTLLCLITLVATSCDAPRIRGVSDSKSEGFTYDIPSNGTVPTPTATAADVTRTEETATPVATVPSDIDHCLWSSDGQTGFASEHLHLGKFTICKSRTKDTDIYIQLQSPFNDAQLCIIPTYNSGTRSIYIGEPRCIFVQESGRIYKVEMLKNRSGYSNFNVTGAMIMKDKMYQYGFPYGSPYRNMLTVDAYLFCANKLDQTGDTRYCEAFSRVGQYVYFQF